MKVYLIDANSLIYRIYHALPRLEDNKGRPVQVLYGLANILLKVLKPWQPDYIFSLYDRPEPTLRHKIFKDYKATRPPITDDLRLQIQLSKKIFSAFNIPIIEKIGYEADDLIATLKEKLKDKAEEVIIVSGDFDTLQLIDQKTKVYIMQRGLTQINIYDLAKIQERFGILPSQIPDYKALVGDSSDNIPGISGIGPKTATKILKEANTINEIIEVIKSKKIKIDQGLASKIISNKDKILFYKDLLTLRNDINLEETNLRPYNGFKEEDLVQVFEEFNFKSLLKKIRPQFPSHSLIGQYQLAGLEDISAPFFFFLDGDKIKVVDSSDKVKILPKEVLVDLLKLPLEKTTYDLKVILKEILKEDFYFDKKVDISKIYDLKLMFWLLNPEIKNPSLEKIIFYFNQQVSDCILSAFSVGQLLKQKLEEENLLNLYVDIELPLIPILGRAEIRGIKLDLENLENFKNRIKERNNQLAEEIFSLVGIRFNLNSPSQLREILFERLRLKTKGIKKTDKGMISTRENELLKIVDQHPVIEKILNYRKINKFLTTYTDSLLKNYNQDLGRIFTIFQQTGSSTGRVISENPNLQNLPLVSDLSKVLRKSFISEKNFTFISGDYINLELRLLAHLSQDENLRAVFLNDLDIHSQTAKILFGDESLQNRRKAKMINFGICYGISAKGLAERLRIQISEAEKLIERFFYFYPQVKKLRDDFIDFARTYGYSQNIFGRKRFLPSIYSDNYQEKRYAERVALNMPLQSFGADLIKKVLVEIDKEIFLRNWQDKVYLTLLIHDEIIYEVNNLVKEEFKFIIKEKMEGIFPLSIPLKVKIKEGESLAALNDA